MDDYSHRKVKPLERRKRRKPLSEEIQSMVRLLSVTLFILGSASIVSYLYLNATKSGKGYTLNELQQEYMELQSEANRIDHEILKAQSIQNVEADVPTEMIQSSDTSYMDGEHDYAQNTW